MDEEVNNRSVTETVQSAPMASLNDAIASKTDNNKRVLQPTESQTEVKKAKMSTESSEDALALKVAQLTKELEECRKERDRYKIAHLTSEAEKKEVITMMEYEDQLKAMEIESLKMALQKSEVEKEALITKMDNEEKLKAVAIENLKVAHANAELEWKFRIDKLEYDVNSKAREIECLQKMESEWKSRIAQLEKEVEVAKNAENHKISEDVAHGFEKVEKNLMSLLDRPTEKTIRWRFTEISKLTEHPVHSQPTEFAGITWRIRLHNRDGHLAFVLEAIKFGAARSACAVIADLQLLSQKDDTIVKHHKFEKPRVYDHMDGWGKIKFMPFEDLLKGDTVEDDSILVAVVIKVFPSN